MADVAISYSHLDAELAGRVRQEFISNGSAVWMDEAGDYSGGAEDITLPWGQAHWDVITTEFAAANVVVVVDTARWRASRYCQDEYQFLTTWGKWVEFIDATTGITPERLAERVRSIVGMALERRPVTAAHARLVRLVRSGFERPHSRVERLLGRAEERDARTLLTSTPDSSGVTMTEALAGHARTALERARYAKRRLRQMAVAATAILAVLALVGVVALVFARSGYRAAAAASSRSQALELAARAQSEFDTLKALGFAREAEGLAHNKTSQEAVNVATANDARLRTIVLGPQEYLGAVWAADAPIVVGYSASKIAVIDTDSGVESKVIDVPDGIQIGTLAVSRDGARAAFVTRGDRSLHVVDFADGGMQDLPYSDVSAVSTGDGEELWWASDDRSLYRAALTRLPAGDAATRYELPAAALALDISPERKVVDYADVGGRVHTATYDGTGLSELEAIDVAPPDMVAQSSRQAPAAIKRCGDNVFGGIEGSAAIRGTVFSRFNGALTTGRLFGSITKPVCNEDNTAWYTLLTTGKPITFVDGSSRPIVPSGSMRYLPVADPKDKRTAVLTNDGKLYQVRAYRTDEWPAEGAMALLPMSSAEYYVRSDGSVVNVATGAVTGTIGSPYGVSASVIADNALVLTDAGLAHIDSSGHPETVLEGDASRFRWLRAGADGQHFVATLENSAILFTPDGRSRQVIRINGLESSEGLVDTDISPDGRIVAFSTDEGRIGTVSIDPSAGTVSDAQMWDQRLPGGAGTHLTFVPGTGNLVVAPNDGAVRLLDDEFNVLATSFYGSTVDHVMATGHWVALTSMRLGTVLYDARDLVVQDRITQEQVTTSPNSVRLDATHKRLAALSISDPEAGEGSDGYHVPLPGLDG